jgi:hypothetical protein
LSSARRSPTVGFWVSTTPKPTTGSGVRPSPNLTDPRMGQESQNSVTGGCGGSGRVCGPGWMVQTRSGDAIRGARPQAIWAAPGACRASPRGDRSGVPPIWPDAGPTALVSQTGPLPTGGQVHDRHPSGPGEVGHSFDGAAGPAGG